MSTVTDISSLGRAQLSRCLPTFHLKTERDPMSEMLCSVRNTERWTKFRNPTIYVYRKIVMMLLENMVTVCWQSAARACCSRQKLCRYMDPPTVVFLSSTVHVFVKIILFRMKVIWRIVLGQTIYFPPYNYQVALLRLFLYNASACVIYSCAFSSSTGL